jgi:hypothetical protein
MSTDESNRRGREDERLESLFRALNVPCPEEDFVAGVMRRVRRGVRVRRLVLGTAAAVGLTVSAVPISRGATALLQELAAADASTIAMWLLLLLAPAAARWLAC